MNIDSSEEFDEWLESQPAKYEAQIRRRILLIEAHGHFGDCKNLGDGLFELRWKNGRRVYFTRIDEESLMLLLGGGKNEQSKQIQRARHMLA